MDTIENFIGIFPAAVSKELCEKAIEHFHYIQKTRGYGWGSIRTRQEIEGKRLPGQARGADSDLYFFEDEPLDLMMERNASILQEYIKATHDCYEKFKKKYGILESLSTHQMSHSIKMQKYKPSQGYHVWHCDTDSITHSRRIMVSILYLNTVKKGGETEFLYQKLRVPPEQGNLVIFPATWTHSHRGNPPLEGNKYIINGWIEFSE